MIGSLFVAHIIFVAGTWVGLRMRIVDRSWWFVPIFVGCVLASAVVIGWF